MQNKTLLISLIGHETIIDIYGFFPLLLILYFSHPQSEPQLVGILYLVE